MRDEGEDRILKFFFKLKEERNKGNEGIWEFFKIQERLNLIIQIEEYSSMKNFYSSGVSFI